MTANFAPRLKIFSAALIFAIAGCTAPKESKPDPVSTPEGASVISLEPLTPGATPYEEAQITMKGITIKAKLERKEAGRRVTFLVKVGGQPLEEEVYDQTDEAFSYIGSTTEKFDPPIPLLTAKMSPDESADWKGKIVMGGQTFGAEASITRSKEALNLTGGPYETVRSKVDLTIQTGQAKPSKRSLTFWFAPDKGIVKRTFDDSSTREPMPTETVAEEAS